MVDGGAVALMGNRLVVQLAPSDYRPRPGGFSGPGRYAPQETRAHVPRVPGHDTHTHRICGGGG